MSDMLSLTTVLKPTKKFLVDGSEYEILGVDHLSPEEEAEVVALFSRYGVLQSELEVEKNVSKGTPKAMQVRQTRLTLLTKLTTLNPSVAAKLPLTQQVRLLEAIQAEVEAEDEDEPVEQPQAQSAGATLAEQF
jgi:hypothetical protein